MAAVAIDMWGLEHTLMSAAALCFGLWFLWGRNFSWLGAAALSQLPFWVGLFAYMATDDPSPVNINLAVNLVAAGMFVEWGHKLQLQNRGGVVHVWLCGIFLVAASVDVIQLLYPVPFYILAQELIHYSALITIGGRAYVKRIDGSRRHRRDRSPPEKGGELV